MLSIKVRLTLLFIVSLILMSCSGDGDSKPAASTISSRPTTLNSSTHKTISFNPSYNELLNPERGTFSSVILTEIEGHMDWYADDGYRLVFDNIDLGPYRNSPLPVSFINKLKSGLAAARTSGIKVIFRASYSGSESEPDASLERVLEHIAQLKPVFEEYEDVISVVQAGFIGAWGEWHASSNHLTDTAPQKAIRDALLNAVPDTRMVQFRYLKDVINWYPEPLSNTQAFTGADQSRVGFHNDCFIADVNDTGTYTTGKIEEEKVYQSSVAPYIATGGEVCTANEGTNKSYRSCANATESMRRFHYSYMSEPGMGTTISILKSEGCWDEIKRKLGYRYIMQTAQIPNSATAGQRFTAQITVANEGYASLYNPRPVFLVLEGAARQNIPIEADPRKWQPGESVLLNIDTVLPGNLPSGDYKVALWMPDASPSIQNNPRFSIQTANSGTWDANQGYNRIGEIEVK